MGYAERRVKGGMEVTEAIFTGIAEWMFVMLKTTFSCLLIIASNPIGGIILFLILIWMLA